MRRDTTGRAQVRAAAAIAYLVAVGALGATAFAAETSAQKSAYTPPAEKLHVFLLIGQSNMAGRAKIEPRDAEPIPSAYLFDGKGWLPAKPPYNLYAPLRKTVKMQRLNGGPSFARAYRKANPNVPIGIVCAARGGTSITQWSRVENNKAKSLYWRAVEMARQAAKTGTLKGVLWHQGESDVSARTDKYPTLLKELVANVRKDLAAPDLPFVYGQIAPGRKKSAARQKAIAGFNAMLRKQPARIPHTGCAKADDLKTFDGVHFDAPSYRRLGQRYAEEMLRLLARTPGKRPS